jgi:hypothetical protein
VQVSDSEFAAALTKLWLDMPMRVATSHPPLHGGPVLGCASVPMGGGVWQSNLTQAYGRFCERCGTPGDCLTLLEDGPHLQDDDKRSIALALAIRPALEGVDAELRALIDPTRVLAILGVTIVVYMGLLLAPVPEPVTKGMALAFTVLMWSYLGWEFFDVLRAYARLHEDAPRATTFRELREIGDRFGRVIGPNSVRIFVMVGTTAMGGTTALASRAPKLPGFGQASRTVEANVGWRLVDAATGAERVIVSVPEGTIRLVLAPHVVAMAGRAIRWKSCAESGQAPTQRTQGMGVFWWLQVGHGACGKWEGMASHRRADSGERKAVWGRGAAQHGECRRAGEGSAHPCQRVLLVDPRRYYQVVTPDRETMAQHPVIRGAAGIRTTRHRKHQEWSLEMNSKTSLDELAGEFAQNVAAQTDAIWAGDAKTGNKHARRYLAAFKNLRNHGDAGRDALASLLTHPRMDVRVKAAIYLLADRPAQAVPVLEEAAKSAGMVPFEASQALRYWNEGTWSLDVD